MFHFPSHHIHHKIFFVKLILKFLIYYLNLGVLCASIYPVATNLKVASLKSGSKLAKHLAILCFFQKDTQGVRMKQTSNQLQSVCLSVCLLCRFKIFLHLGSQVCICPLYLPCLPEIFNTKKQLARLAPFAGGYEICHTNCSLLNFFFYFLWLTYRNNKSFHLLFALYCIVITCSCLSLPFNRTSTRLKGNQGHFTPEVVCMMPFMLTLQR